MKTRLIDVAHVIRSKNAGPFELTLDILFEDLATYEAFRDRRVFDKATVEALYGAVDVLDVIYFDPAHAVKVTMRRSVASGAPGDTDVYGAQQHGPLLGFEFDLG